MAFIRGKLVNIFWPTSILLCHINLLPVYSSHCHPLQVVPGMDLTVYKNLGDVNIGVFISASSSSGSSTCLESSLRGSSVIEYTEAVAYAVKSVNENPQLLPNITLGFVQVNDCSNENIALAVALSFLPRVTYETQSLDVCSNSSCSTLPSEYEQLNSTRCSEMPFYDIVGVIGPSTSQKTVAVSKLFSAYRIPIIGCLATSDELSDKQRHPFYSRMIPSDIYLVDAVLQFAQSNGWSYVSVVYMKDSYGQKSFDHLKEEAPKLGICVATSHAIDDTSNLDDVVSDLKSYPKARVVILFVGTKISINLLNSVNKSQVVAGHFIWVWSDSWNSLFRKLPSEIKQSILGSFSIGLYATYVHDYLRYLRNLKVDNTTNPWYKSQWEYLADCSLNGDEQCNPYIDILNSHQFGFDKSTSLYIDAVNVFANGIHNLMADLCPFATRDESRACINGDVLNSYLRSVSFNGSNGRIQFDKNGDNRGKYEIRQFVFGHKYIPVLNISVNSDFLGRSVAIYDVETHSLSWTDVKINWSFAMQAVYGQPLQGTVPSVTVPESICSKPCGVGQYKIMKDQKCCWECHKCRENEKVTSKGTRCELCDVLTWPDKSTGYITCSLIPPTYPLVTDMIPVILICLATVALLSASLVVIGYVHFRDSRVIKAASRELSITKMVAIFSGYVAVILFQTPPTHEKCSALYFLFCLSFALIYSSLLVKTIRIYRIFQSGKVNNKRPRLISPCSQLVMTGILIGIQMLICTSIYIFYSPTAVSTQPNRTERFVELSCDITSPGLASFLTYNLILVILCSVFAFKTRKLPDNFNESKFISMCVSTTLVIWMAFVPTYFTSPLNSSKVMLLSIALLLNHTVVLIFLFVPKIYAAVYVQTENFVPSRFQTAAATTGVFKQSCSNQVTPSPSICSVSPLKVQN